MKIEKIVIVVFVLVLFGMGQALGVCLSLTVPPDRAIWCNVEILLALMFGSWILDLLFRHQREMEHKK